MNRWAEVGAATTAALAVVCTIAGLGRPRPRPLPAAACARAVQVDGQLRCDAETPRHISELCGDASGTAAVQPGDALYTDRLCGRGEVAPGDPGWSRMDPADLKALAQPVDVNEAGLPELDSLPGVGPTIARRIAEGRPYRAPADLLRVKGIGPKTFAKLQRRVIVD